MNALHRIAALLHRNKNVSTRTNSKRQLRLESLEERQLQSVTPLGWFPEMECVTEISPSRPSDDNSGDDPFSYLPGSDEWNRLAAQGTVLDEEVIREAFRGLELESPDLMNTTSGCGGGGGPERGSAYYTGCGSAVWSACSGAPVPSYSLSVLQSPIREGVTGNSTYPLDALLHLTSSWPYADTNYIKIVNGGFIDTTGCDYGFSAVDITKFGGVTSWGQGIAASFTGGEITLTFRAEDDAIPHYDNDVEIDFYVGNYPDTSGCSGLYGCGWQTQIHGAKSGTVTVKDNDNWTVSASSVTNRDKALEPCGNTDVVGEFEIKRTDDTDTHYGINAVFALGGTADNKGLDYNLAPVYRSKDAQGNDVETLGTIFAPRQVTDKDGNQHWGGSVLIPIGEESVRLRVLPKSDSIFEQDETVTLEVIDATNGGIHYRTGTGSGTVTIMQAPEFISDTDRAVDITKDNYTVPFAVNNDIYNGYISSEAEAGEKVNTAVPIFAAHNRGVAYCFVLGNDVGQTLYRKSNGDWSLTSDNGNNVAWFTIDAGNGEIKTATDFAPLTLPDMLSFTIKAYDSQYPQQYDTATVNVFTKFDLDIDSDNNNNLNWPDNSAIEEFLEDDDFALGKLILPAYEASAFTPIRLRLPKNLNPNDATFKISFDFECISGCVNIFTKDKNIIGGLQIIDGLQYTLAELNYSPTDGGITLYLAGMPPKTGYQTKTQVNTRGIAPSEQITAALSMVNQVVAMDTIKYLVAAQNSFYYEYYHNLALRNAVAADLIYGNRNSSPYGFKLLNVDELTELGVPANIHGYLTEDDPNTGFNAGLYREGVNGRFVLAFAGTDDWENVVTDIWNGAGYITDQYLNALQIGDTLKNVDSVEDRGITVTGHSLGGGLASAAYCTSEFETYSFNAAGLSRSIIASCIYVGALAVYDAAATSGLMDAYYADFDILSALQDLSPLSNALGQRIGLDSGRDFEVFFNVIRASIPKPGLPIGPLLSTVIIMVECHLMDAIYYGMLGDKNLD